jgi:hypothetical protein
MSRLGKMPSWQRRFILSSFFLCALSGLVYFFFPQLQLYVFIPASRFILATHGISASFVLIALGLVLPVHLKAGWLAKSNRLSGVFQIVCLLTLIGSGFLLYYGPEPLRDLTLLAIYLSGTKEVDPIKTWLPFLYERDRHQLFYQWRHRPNKGFDPS